MVIRDRPAPRELYPNSAPAAAEGVRMPDAVGHATREVRSTPVASTRIETALTTGTTGGAEADTAEQAGEAVGACEPSEGVDGAEAPKPFRSPATYQYGWLPDSLGGWFERGATVAGISKEEAAVTFMDAAARRLAEPPPSRGDAGGPSSREDRARPVLGDQFKAEVVTWVKSAVAEGLREANVLTRSDIDLITDPTAKRVLELSIGEWGPGVGPLVGPKMMRQHRFMQVLHGLDQTNKAAGVSGGINREDWWRLRKMTLLIVAPELMQRVSSQVTGLVAEIQSGRVPPAYLPAYYSMLRSTLETVGAHL
jgi:hypothetical protein